MLGVINPSYEMRLYMVRIRGQEITSGNVNIPLFARATMDSLLRTRNENVSDFVRVAASKCLTDRH